jgi:hypothetical protein
MKPGGFHHFIQPVPGLNLIDFVKRILRNVTTLAPSILLSHFHRVTGIQTSTSPMPNCGSKPSPDRAMGPFSPGGTS